MVWNKEGAANLGLQPQRIDNLIDYLDRMESILDESDFTPDEREKLIETLRLEVVEVLKVAFNEGDRTIRRSAIYGLSKIGLNQSNDFFFSALSDSDEHVRGWAAEALGVLRDSRTIPALIKALADENHYVCFNVAAALKQFAPDQLLHHLVGALKDNDRYIRRRVGKLLGEIGDLTVTDALISALHDEDAGVRYEAAEALRKLKSSAAILPLISALTDSNHDVRAVAIMALGNFGDERAIEPLTAMLVEQKDHRHACLESLSQICGEENMENFYELIRNSHKCINETSRTVLEHIYAKRAGKSTENPASCYQSVGNHYNY